MKREDHCICLAIALIDIAGFMLSPNPLLEVSTYRPRSVNSLLIRLRAMVFVVSVG